MSASLLQQSADPAANRASVYTNTPPSDNILICINVMGKKEVEAQARNSGEINFHLQ
jgi:hypothetical protein